MSSGELKAIELYDHSDREENVNMANLKENESLVADWARQMKQGWKSAKPDSK